MFIMIKIDKNQLSKLSVILTLWMILVSSTTISQDLSSLYRNLAPSVVIIHTISDDSTPVNKQINQSLGSGVLVDSLGLIITASHVVHSANIITIKMAEVAPCHNFISFLLFVLCRNFDCFSWISTFVNI